jgi:hypothetical protein
MITDVVVREAPERGRGVFARRSFRKGEFIFRRRHGRVVSRLQEAQLSADDRRHLTELDFNRSAVLLPPGCYLNHSCDPNAMRSGVKVFAWRAIRNGRSAPRRLRGQGAGTYGLHSMNWHDPFTGRLPAVRAAVLALALTVGACGSPALNGASAPPAEGWYWAGPPVALVGRPANVAFERHGSPTTAQSRTIHIDARCVDCDSAAPLSFDVTSPVPRYELDQGVAEAIGAIITFPTEGRWHFEPFGGELVVRSPTSAAAPVVVVQPGSPPLSSTCGETQIQQAVTHLQRGFNQASASDLGQALSPEVDFSMSGGPLPQFTTHARDDVLAYARSRTLVGERLYPYLVFAGAASGNGTAVDLAIYLVRQAPDLPSPRGYRRVFAGSRLSCPDALLLRFNAALLNDEAP